MAIGKPQQKPVKNMPPKRPPGAAGYDGSPASLEENLKRLLEDEQYQDSATEEKNAAAESASEQAPLILLVNSRIAEAVKKNASDIHIEPFENMVRVRFRIDGTLQEIQKVPAKLGGPLISRLKIMADLDICEKRVPQDGSIRFKQGNAECDLRLSTLPSVFGEKAVMRVLGKTNLSNDLSKLSIPEAQLKIMRRAIQKPDGLILVTGPTGSGKTTTLYAAINELNEVGVSVFTAEDPVEGTIAGVTQCQTNSTVGYTFASILRSFLRQDPDIILVGEIRDQETAEIAMKAALTGHLVLSTLHTNCAASTITRLLHMGIPNYLVASAVSCIIAQRLVRRICDKCKRENTLSEEALLDLGIPKGMLKSNTVFHGRGCANCHNTGFKGRAAVYEVLPLTDEIRRMVVSGASKSDIKLMARRQGMVTLREAGIALVQAGVTTIEEVLGITNEDDEEQTPAPVPQYVGHTVVAAPPPAAMAPSAAYAAPVDPPLVDAAAVVPTPPSPAAEPAAAVPATQIIESDQPMPAAPAMPSSSMTAKPAAAPPKSDGVQKKWKFRREQSDSGVGS